MLRFTFSRFEQAFTANKQFGYRSAFYIPHPEKAHRGGEDSFFLHKAGLCVADGVGGWASSGVDPAIYTRKLINSVQKELISKPFDVTPRDAMLAGIAATHGIQGSCTLVATFINDHRAFTSTTHLVGDCGMICLRDGEILFHTTEQQSRFNCPFQVPSDDVDSGMTNSLDLAYNDLYLLGSDGLFDNLHYTDIKECVLQHTPSNGIYIADTCSSLAEALCSGAFRNSKNRTFVSPFAIHAAQAGYKYLGGKQDDITVAVGVVTSGSVDIMPGFSNVEEVDFPGGRSVRKQGI